MVRRLLPLVSLAVVVLSGCMAGVGGGPTPTPTSTALDPAEADLPPGVNESGVTNVSALVAAHNETLRAEGFVMNGTYFSDPPKTGRQDWRYHAVVGPGADRFFTMTRRTQYMTEAGDATVSQRTQMWGNATSLVHRTTIENQTESGSVRRRNTSSPLTRAAEYGPYLNYGEFDVERVVARDDHTYTTLVATGLSEDVGENVTFEARFIVDERGIIHQGNVTLDYGPDARVQHAEYRVVRLGASPERPAWVANATAE